MANLDTAEFNVAMAAEIKRLADGIQSCENHVSQALSHIPAHSLPDEVVEGLQELDHLVQVLRGIDGIYDTALKAPASDPNRFFTAIEACHLSSLKARLLGHAPSSPIGGQPELF